MSRALKGRLRKLEAQAAPDTSADIPVWCEEPEDVEATIAAMIARGEISEADRSRCKWWPDAKGCKLARPYEEWLLDLSEQEDAQSQKAMGEGA